MNVRFSHWFRLWCIAIITFGFIVGCSGTSSQTARLENSRVSPAECRTIQHAMGETCVPLNPQRLVVLGVPTMANALALGVKPVGTVFYFDKTPPYLKGKLDGIKTVGTSGQPNLEKILTLRPDLIIAMNEWRVSYQQLSQIAPTVVDNWQGYPSWKEHFNFVAEVLGKTEAAEQVWANYEQRIQKLRAALNDKYRDLEVSYVYLCCGGISIDLKNSFSGTILDEAGLSRPPSQNIENDSGLVILSEELLTDMDGDVIFLSVDEDDDSANMLKQLKQKPLWNQLEAVQEGKVYPVNLATWRGGNPLAADAVIDDLFKYLVEIR